MSPDTEEKLIADVAEIKAILIRREFCEQKCSQVYAWAFGNGVKGADETIRALVKLEDSRILSKLDNNVRDLVQKQTQACSWNTTLWNMVPGIITGFTVGLLLILSRVLFGI